jgi:hypothetical protein
MSERQAVKTPRKKKLIAKGAEIAEKSKQEVQFDY